MRSAARNSTPRSRSRRKTTEAAPVIPKAPPRNVGPIEALLSLTLGVSMVIAALVPRSLKQLLLLGLGGGLAYRGLTGECGVYRAAGIDTTGGSRLGQANGKVPAATKD